eukprot:m.41841 g.41841  ORF g.41841 m.41841 type:complete len:551 (+) comp18927_c0_seq1:640-2292(+)
MYVQMYKHKLVFKLALTFMVMIVVGRGNASAAQIGPTKEMMALISQTMQRAQRLHETDPKAAIRLLEEVTRQHFHPGVLMVLGQIYFEQGSLRLAHESFVRVVETSPNPQAHFSLGVIEERWKHGDSAIKHYQGCLNMKPNHAEALCNLGILTATHKKQLRKGKDLLERALKEAPADKVARKNLILINLQIKEIQTRRELSEKEKYHEHGKRKTSSQPSTTTDIADNDVTCVHVEEVKRVSYKDLTLRQFYTEFELKGKPLIITDVAGPKWTLQDITDNCDDAWSGDSLKTESKSSSTWAGLAVSRNISISEYIQDLRFGNNHEYLFDYNIQKHCPKLLAHFTVPKYFSQDFLQRIREKSKKSVSYRDYWPSLFVGGEETTSELHVDAWCSHFYMQLIKGEKEWIIFPEKDSTRLYRDHLSATFLLNSTTLSLKKDNPNQLCMKSATAEKYPLVLGIKPLRANLKAGEAIFVPCLMPHFVITSGSPDSIAISGNFVDKSNFECARQGLSRLGLSDAGATHASDAMSLPAFDTSMHLDLDHDVPWSDFKQH